MGSIAMLTEKVGILTLGVTLWYTVKATKVTQAVGDLLRVIHLFASAMISSIQMKSRFRFKEAQLQYLLGRECNFGMEERLRTGQYVSLQMEFKDIHQAKDGNSRSWPS